MRIGIRDSDESDLESLLSIPEPEPSRGQQTPGPSNVQKVVVPKRIAAVSIKTGKVCGGSSKTATKGNNKKPKTPAAPATAKGKKKESGIPDPPKKRSEEERNVVAVELQQKFEKAEETIKELTTESNRRQELNFQLGALLEYHRQRTLKLEEENALLRATINGPSVEGIGKRIAIPVIANEGDGEVAGPSGAVVGRRAEVVVDDDGQQRTPTIKSGAQNPKTVAGEETMAASNPRAFRDIDYYEQGNEETRVAPTENQRGDDERVAGTISHAQLVVILEVADADGGQPQTPMDSGNRISHSSSGAEAPAPSNLEMDNGIQERAGHNGIEQEPPTQNSELQATGQEGEEEVAYQGQGQNTTEAAINQLEPTPGPSNNARGLKTRSVKKRKANYDNVGGEAALSTAAKNPRKSARNTKPVSYKEK